MQPDPPPVENPIEAITQHLQNSEGMTLRDMLILAAVGAAVALEVLLLTFLGRAMGWWSRQSASNLFRELCRVHELGAADRSLLLKLARGHGITDKAAIFLMPERFEESSLPATLRPYAREIARLRDTLFGPSF